MESNELLKSVTGHWNSIYKGSEVRDNMAHLRE